MTLNENDLFFENCKGEGSVGVSSFKKIDTFGR